MIARGCKVNLGDVASYINGYAFKPTDRSESGRKIIRIQDLTGNAYESNLFDGTRNSKFLFKHGDVLISWSASIGVYVWNEDDAWLNQHIFKVQFDKDGININKDFYIQQVTYILEENSKLAHGATTKHFTKSIFNNLPFWLPDIKAQISIANILTKIDSVRITLESQLSKLDKLIKSRFTAWGVAA